MPPVDASKVSEEQWKRFEQGFADRQQANNSSPLGSLGPLNPQQIADYWQSVVDQTTKGSDNYRHVVEKINAAMDQEFKQRQESMKKAMEKFREYTDDLRDHQAEFNQPNLVQKAMNELQDKDFGTSLRAVSSKADLDDANALKGPTMAEARLRVQQQLGSISASGAAYQQAAISTARYTAALEKLQVVQAELGKQYAEAKAANNHDAVHQIEDKLRENNASQITLDSGYQAQRVADNATKYLATWQGEWDQTLNKMSEEFSNFGGGLAKTFSQTVASVNEELTRLLTSRYHNGYDTRQAFKAVGHQAFAGVTDAGLKGIEGMGISGLQKLFGHGAKADGSASNPFHVILAGMNASASEIPSAANGIASMLSKLPGAEAMKSAASSSVGFIGSIISALPHFATGGPIGAGMASLVGERGPELFVPHVAGKIVPNNRLGLGEVHHHHSYNIDARGATNPGEVERMVMRGIAKASPHIIKHSVQAGHEYNRRRPPSARR